MNALLETENNFKSLSIKDLLYARDLYHYHLINKENVVGTAVGLYLIRDTDPYPHRMSRSGTRPVKKQDSDERTFLNSSVRDYSWPCILVLVKKWQLASEFGTRGSAIRPQEMVPKTLYLPDGRMVPVCVVKVEQAEPDHSTVPNWHWPDSMFGGGMPIIVETQKLERRATAGCLVTDGHTVYLLTSRHVCGSEGETVSTIAGGRVAAIGKASGKHLTRIPFIDAYPDFPAQRTYVNLDVGLIKLDDIRDWTSQIFGLGSMGPIADLSDHNLSLRLIDAPVCASGGASGRLDGQIKAIFYRYKSIGGFDYVADFLIAPQQIDHEDGGKASPAIQTQPGDSGAVWHLVTNEKGESVDRDSKASRGRESEKEVLRPLAVEWGGQVLFEAAQQQSYAFALATSLTTVCRSLDVELVLEHNTGVLPYWGQTGHYSIASFAIDALPSGKLKSFLNDNVDRISFSIGELTPKQIQAALKAARDAGEDGFVPLADVPDIVWKTLASKRLGGRDDRWAGHGSTGPEHPTHYADIDEKRSSDKKTLRQLCIEDPKNISVPFWQAFYDETGHNESRDRGLLPFRVWQFFRAMVDFAKKGSADEFLCAAGILSHYVGDACQPLHGSMYADGYGEEGGGSGVHSLYESKMIDRFSTEILEGIPDVLKKSSSLPQITTGQGAAKAIIALMERSATTIPPKKLIDAYIDAGGEPKAAERDALWGKFGKQTIQVMADGATVLARIWEGAWAQGNGNAISSAKLGTINEKALIRLYRDESFVPSLDLDHVAPVL